MTRSIEALVEEQARRWQLLRQDRREEPRRPVVTVSRLHGAGGEEVARKLCAELGLDLFDREIIQRIAESTHLSRRVVESLDERDRELLADWLSAFSSQGYLGPAEYHQHLARLVGAVAHHGGAVILGRGAHLILGHGEALRVFVVAPLEARVRAVMERERTSEREARRRILAVESDRRAFLLKHFHADFSDPAAFDLVVNTAELGVAGACETVRAALEARRSAAAPLVARGAGVGRSGV